MTDKYVLTPKKKEKKRNHIFLKSKSSTPFYGMLEWATLRPQETLLLSPPGLRFTSLLGVTLSLYKLGKMLG